MFRTVCASVNNKKRFFWNCVALHYKMDSETESDVNLYLGEDCSYQLTFVNILQEHKVVLQKSQVPAVKNAKEAALKKIKMK